MGKKSKELERLAQALRDSLLVGARAYAVRRQDGSKPIVDHHFTEGNQERYGWAPLSRDYFLAKQGALSERQIRKGGNFRGSRLDKNAGFRSNTGTMMGEGTGTNLPMLVRSGQLRKAANSGEATIQLIGGGVVRITFHLPSYAKYLHEGTPKMPPRSPVEPNQGDRQEVVQEMKNYLNRFSGNGRTASAVDPKPY